MVLVGELPVRQRHATHFGRGGARLEAGTEQIERPVAARCAIHAGQRRHDLQRPRGAAIEGLHLGRKVRQRDAHRLGAVDRDVEHVRPIGLQQTIQRIDRVEVELQRVGLARSQPAQLQRVAGAAEAAQEVGEHAGCAGIHDVLRPCRVRRAALEIIREYRRRALRHRHVVDAPALVADPLQATVQEVDRRGRRTRRELDRHAAIDRIVVTVEAKVALANIHRLDSARRRQHRHLNLQRRPRCVDRQRRHRERRHRPGPIPGLEHDFGPGVEVRTGQRDHLTRIRRRRAGRGRAVRRRGGDRGQHRQHDRRVEVQVELQHRTLVRAHQQIARRVEHHARYANTARHLQPEGDMTQHRAGVGHLHEVGTLIRTEPQRALVRTAGGRIERQTGITGVERRGEAVRRVFLPGTGPVRNDRDDPVRSDIPVDHIDPVGPRVIQARRRVVILRQRKRGDDRARQGVDRDREVRVRRPIEQQQTPGRYHRRAKRELQRRDLHPAVERRAAKVRRAAGTVRDRDRADVLSRRHIDQMQLRGAAVIRHPELRRVRRIERHRAQQPIAGLELVQRQRRRGAARRRCRHRAKTMHRLGGEINLPVFRRTTVINIGTGIARGVADRAALEVIRDRIAGTPLLQARAKQIHRSRAGDRVTAQRRHDLQRLRDRRAQDADGREAVRRGRHDQRRRGSVRRRRGRVRQIRDDRAVVTGIGHDRAGRGGQTGSGQCHRLTGIGGR